MNDGGLQADVVIAGAGVAGLTAATQLARAGLSVTCVDPDPTPVWRAGESLDWSAGPLLERLGLPIEWLVSRGLATYKREVRGRTAMGVDIVGRPPDWVVRWPLRFDPKTVHIQRGAFDLALHERARADGVTFVCDGVADVATAQGRMIHCTTRSGQRLSGSWFIDATGRARVLARALGISAAHESIQRVSLWSHCKGSTGFEGTKLHLDGDADELEWAWEIPTGPDRLSVGVVMAAERFRECRRGGESLAAIWGDRIARFPECTRPEAGRVEDIKVRGYRANLSTQMCGPNWLLTGEAACFVDPITSIGVTSAMRHGSEAAEVIVAALRRPQSAVLLMERYQQRITNMAKVFNEGVQKLLYDPTVRDAFGMRWAARAYMLMGYAVTALYGKLPATSGGGTAVLVGLCRFFRLWIAAWVAAARLIAGSRRRFRMPTSRRAKLPTESAGTV